MDVGEAGGEIADALFDLRLRKSGLAAPQRQHRLHQVLVVVGEAGRGAQLAFLLTQGLQFGILLHQPGLQLLPGQQAGGGRDQGNGKGSPGQGTSGGSGHIHREQSQGRKQQPRQYR